MKLSQEPAKRCHTVTAWTLYQEKTLLVKHKKLGIWLAPGGHVEENELPHQAAEREFFEETGIRGNVVTAFDISITSNNSELLPLPFYCNLHEINKPRGESFCEQHYSWGFFIQVSSDVGMNSDDEGVDDIGWFSEKELLGLETTEGIRNEARYVFAHFPDRV